MNQDNKKVIDIKPVTKWRRILVFLGDFFITTILGFILFNVAAFPISKAIIQYDKQIEIISQCLDESNDMLVNSGFLYYPREEENLEKNLPNSIDYTYHVFISYYLFDEESPVKNNPQLGHKESNEIFKTYYVDYKKSPDEYLSIFKEVNAKNSFFEVGETVDTIKLKEVYKNSLATEYLELDNGADLPDHLQTIKENVYEILFYDKMYEDILQNDLIIGEKSYKTYFNQVTSINNTIDWAITISSIITGAFCSIIVYLVYPLTHKEHRTVTMSIMRIDRLLINNLSYIKRSNVILQFPFHLIFGLGGVLFYPMLMTGLTYVFNLPLLVIFLLISSLLTIVSFVIMLLNQYGRSGSDLLSFTVLVPTSELDMLYTVSNDSEDQNEK